MPKGGVMFDLGSQVDFVTLLKKEPDPPIASMCLMLKSPNR
jgi:hypothetical protein